MIKILLAEPSGEIRSVLRQLLETQYTLLCCQTGEQALELLRRERPDLLVMDLMLPQIDGLTLLSTARREEICPPALVTSCFFHDHIINALQRENVVYLMRKPCNLEALAGRIREMAQELSPTLFFRPDSHSLVSSALFELGIPANRIGCSNIREAVIMLRQDPCASLSKEIYPALAAGQNVSPGSIEKNIRDAINDGYQHRSDSVWRRYFPTAPNGQIPRPTNRQFLSTLAQVLFAMSKEA